MATKNMAPIIAEEAQETAVPSASGQTGIKRGLPRRFGFRLLFTYVFFYLWSLFAPGLWEPLVTWTGTHFFHTEVVQEYTGSGDTAYNWVMEADSIVLALAAALLWALFDRKRLADARFSEWMLVAVRFSLAMQMLSYGIIKIIPTQFSAPSLTSLTKPLGEHSPMGLLWEFMGTSTAYTIFAGSVEAIGGLLLLSRRTTLLGALASIVAMSNVVALNFCYDVPVKLFSSHLLLLALLLAAPDAGRLATIFLLNRLAPPMTLRPHSVRRWVNWTLLSVKFLLFGALIYFSTMNALDVRKTFALSGPQLPLSGIWNADEPAQPGLPEADRWRQAVFEFPHVIGLQMADGQFRAYRLSVDETRHTLTLTRIQHGVRVFRLSYTQVSHDRITLHGVFEGYPLTAALTQQPKTKSLLLSRGFHWISPVPFNR